MVCRGTSLQLLSKSFQKVSFGIHRTPVAFGEVSSDGYGAISACDNVISPRAV